MLGGQDIIRVSFEGLLPDTKHSCRVRIDIWDWDFVDTPRIVILESPDGFRPHVDERQSLCYLQGGSYIFDRHTPVDNLKVCLALAAQELNRQTDSDYRINESIYEFPRYWSNIKHVRGTIRPERRRHHTNYYRLSDNFLLLGDVPEEIHRMLQSILDKRGRKDDKPLAEPTWAISLDQAPWLDYLGPPQTWGELWHWLEKVDPRSADCLASLVDRKEFAAQSDPVILFHHDATWFGVTCQISRDIRQNLALQPIGRGGRSRLAMYLRKGKGCQLPIQRFSVLDASPDFILHRNIAELRSLQGKNIHLVGAGAIGGFLAHQLCRLGAGANGGCLRIIDPDFHSPGNIGRHLLGMDMLYRDKAKAVAEYMARQFPHSDVEPLVADARRVDGLFDCDLIIDATGEEALSLVLNELHQERIRSGVASPPILFTWVLGNGEAVQALLSDGGQHACYDCLNLPDKDDPLERQRFRVLKELPDTRFVGCQTIRPYAVTAPSLAASLTAQMIADWNAGKPKPRFRTLYLETGDQVYHVRRDSDPDRLKRCRTCASI